MCSSATIQNIREPAGETARQLSVHTAPAEDPSLIPSTHTGKLTNAYDNTASPPSHTHTHTHYFLSFSFKGKHKSVHNLRAMMLADTVSGIVIVYLPMEGGCGGAVFTSQ